MKINNKKKINGSIENKITSESGAGFCPKGLPKNTCCINAQMDIPTIDSNNISTNGFLKYCLSLKMLLCMFF
jgi:hypothetical protein